MKKPLPYEAYESLAEKYAALVDTKPHNAYYDRPAVQSLVDDVKNKSILDAGCGPGVYSEWLVKKGAKVIGIDSSEKMLSFARERNKNSGVFYHANLEEPLDFLADNTFDGILSALTVTYIEDHTKLFKEFSRVLRRNGWFIFSTEHPFFSFKYFGIKNYFETKQVGCDWNGFGEKVYVPSYYHSLGSITQALSDNGFHIEKVIEPKPTDDFRLVDPDGYEKLCRFPLFICFKAVKK